MTLSPVSLPKINLAELTRMQRSWSSLLAGGAADKLQGRLTEVTAFGANPGALRMWQYVPVGLPPHAPLVCVLHGCTQTANGFDSGTGWSVLAERHGFAVVMPEQVRANNAQGCFNWFEPGDTARDQGEAASIRAMIGHMQGRHRIDPNRIFVTGLSAGGAMAAALLAAYPDVFAGGAIVAGLPFGAAGSVQEALGAMYHPVPRTAEAWGGLVRAASPAPQRRPMVSIWQGEADKTVAPANALELAKQWCDVHGLRQEDGVENVVDGMLHRTWRDAAGNVRVELFVAPGLGHGIPVCPGAAGDLGVGHVMPFILEASTSATWRTARGWGLVPVQPFQEKSARPAGPAGPETLPAVLAKALRKLRL